VIKVLINKEIEFLLSGIEYKDSDDYITSCITQFGNWEPNVTKKFLTILDKASKSNEAGIVIDVGAYLGYYSIIAAKKGFKVLAFEPNPEVIPFLKSNISVIPIGLVKVNEFALGNERGLASLTIPEKNLGGAYLEFGKGNESINIRALDSFELPHRVTIFKIDAEGFEVEVIKGAYNTIIQNQIDFVFIEISPKFLPVAETVDKIFKILWKAGYLSFDIGLQDSGKMEDAIKVFHLFSDENTLIKHLNTISQTNFLFIRKDNNRSEFLTGSLWKDELIHEWLLESLDESRRTNNEKESLNVEIMNLTDDLRVENKKLFEELMKASSFQKELIEVIRLKDEQLNSRSM
jgi:FkbM family methyltransferase